MSETKIVVTITNCVQVGQDEFRDVHDSAVFDTSATIKDIIVWAADGSELSETAIFQRIKWSTCEDKTAKSGDSK